jgi:hypothetical protein
VRAADRQIGWVSCAAALTPLPGASQEGTALDGDFAPLSAREMITKGVDELKRTVADKRERERASRDERAAAAADRAGGPEPGGAAAGLAGARKADGAPQEILPSQACTWRESRGSIASLCILNACIRHFCW